MTVLIIGYNFSTLTSPHIVQTVVHFCTKSYPTKNPLIGVPKTKCYEIGVHGLMSMYIYLGVLEWKMFGSTALPVLQICIGLPQLSQQRVCVLLHL